MAAALIAFSIQKALQFIGPVVLRRVQVAIEEAGGKFSSDWRRSLYVHKQLKLALREEAKLTRVSRGARRFLVELLVQEWKAGKGIPGFSKLPPAPPA